MTYKSIKTRVLWARGNSERIEAMRTLLGECIAKQDAGMGAQIISASTNSNTFTMAPNGATFDQYANFISSVLIHLDAGTTPTNRTIGGFRE